MKYIRIFFICIIICFHCFPLPVVPAAQRDTKKDASVLTQYREYHSRLSSVNNYDDILTCGFTPIEKQTFSLSMPKYGEVSMIPALDEKYHRLILFFTDEDGRIVCKTDWLEANLRITGSMYQSCRGIASVSFRDLNRDGHTDIILIAACSNENGSYAKTPYKIGDVLFSDGREGFYRDYRISDKLNRFGMNKSAEMIVSFVRDGFSTEFLYTSSTLDELLAGGFSVIEEQCYPRTFEKLGNLNVVPGTYRISDYDIFMIFFIDEQNYIVFCLQPMGDYESLYSLQGINCRDIDGDGLKDIAILARYNHEDETGQTQTTCDYSIYYQRTGGFAADTDMHSKYRCSDTVSMDELITKARSYWGWKSKDD